jgi:hypothetical protein
MAASHERLVQIGGFDRLDRAEAAATFLAGDGIAAAAVDGGPPFRVAVPAGDADRAVTLLGLSSDTLSDDALSTDLAGPSTADDTAPDRDDPWDAPLPERSIWQRPPWMKLAVLLIVVGMLLPAVLGLLRLYPG